MKYGKYRFSCIFERDAVLPEYKGSTFRGVFGHALRNVVCALKRVECPECLLKEKCVYAFVFENCGHGNGSSGGRRIAAPPHPYVIESPATTETRFKAGDPFDFDLILFGVANDYLPYFIYAIDRMGQMGVGKRIAGKRAGFALQTVSSGGIAVYTSREQKIIQAATVSILSIDVEPVPCSTRIMVVGV